MGSPPEDDSEFRRALADVKPLSRKKRVELRRPAPAPYPRQSRLDEKAVLTESLGPISLDDALDTGEELAFVRNGSREVLRKLRRGRFQIRTELPRPERQKTFLPNLL